MVVAGEPPRGHVRLVHGDDLVPRGKPVPLAGVAHRARPAGVPHGHLELLVGRDQGVGGDLQLVLVGLGERDPGPIDPHFGDAEQEVQVEPAQRLGRLDREGGHAGQAALPEVVAVPHVVGEDVEATVAVEREVGVADAALPSGGASVIALEPGTADAASTRARAGTSRRGIARETCTPAACHSSRAWCHRGDGPLVRRVRQQHVRRPARVLPDRWLPARCHQDVPRRPRPDPAHGCAGRGARRVACTSPGTPPPGAAGSRSTTLMVRVRPIGRRLPAHARSVLRRCWPRRCTASPAPTSTSASSRDAGATSSGPGRYESLHVVGALDDLPVVTFTSPDDARRGPQPAVGGVPGHDGPRPRGGTRLGRRPSAGYLLARPGIGDWDTAGIRALVE